MKLMFASDIHGSAFYCQKMIQAFEDENAERLILLGDLLYHGPRNDLPKEYDPKKVIKMLNDRKNDIYAVRGNCDAEVDQMVLEFPIMAEYALFFRKDRCVYATHGHHFTYDNLPPMKSGDIFIQGHTHVLKAEKKDNLILLNPGSVSLPKEGNIPTYAIMTDIEFKVKGFDGEEIVSFSLE